MVNKKILISFGTRPEWIKVEPIVDVLNNNNYPFDLLFTGQHTDLVNKIIDNITISQSVIIKELCVNRLNNVVCNILSSVTLTDYEYVLVQGDTASAFAVALNAFHNGVKVIHLEAGLRIPTNFIMWKNEPYPEESYRRMISQITDVHLCPTKDNYDNLRGLVRGKKFVIGNTVIDSLVKKNLKVSNENIVLITMHRRENHPVMDKWFKEIEKLSIEYPQYQFIIPLHPNENVQKHKHIFQNVKVIEPIDHNEFLNLLVKSSFVITDSGGIQEECSFYNKHCLVCRDSTERPEALLSTSTLVHDPKYLNEVFMIAVQNKSTNNTKHPCPFGDGRSAEKFYKLLMSDFDDKCILY